MLANIIITVVKKENITYYHTLIKLCFKTYTEQHDERSEQMTPVISFHILT